MVGFTILPEIPQFECSACGKCCSRIRGFAGESERAFLVEYGYGKLPLVQLVPVDEMTFPLWDFEARRFKAYAQELGVDAHIRPYRGVLDLISGKLIVFAYQMDSYACPFLSKEGKCRVYGKERAYVCNLYPLNKSPFLGIGELDESMFSACGRLVGITDSLEYGNKKTLIAQLYKSFGKTFLAAVQHDHLLMWTNRILLDLMKAKKIKPLMNVTPEELHSRVEDAETVDLFDFLVECGMFTLEERTSLLKRFSTYEDAKEQVNQVLGDADENA